MGYLEGLLGGFTGRKREVEQQNYAESLRSSEREQAVLSHLINSPDPKIKALAVSGMLESANPKKRKGGFAGWLGGLESNPHLDAIRAVIAHDAESGVSSGVPGPSPETSATAAPVSPTTIATPAEAPTSAALPESSSTEVGAPPPAPTTVTPGSPGAPLVDQSIGADEMGAPGRPSPQAVLGSTATAPPAGTRKPARDVFQSPEGQIMANTLATGRAKTAAEMERARAIGFTPEEYKALEQAKARRLGGIGGYQSTAGEVIGEDGTVTRTFGAFDRTRGVYIGTDPDSAYFNQPIPGFQPRATGTTQTPEEAAAKAAAVATARGGALAGVPLTTNQRFVATEKLATDWQKLQAPIREMQRQHQLMTTGLQRFQQGDKIGGSQAVLVTFQKILDPTSVVRESEYARSGQGLGLMQRIEGMWERLKTGGAGVPEPELAAMVETGRQFLQGMEGWNQAQRARIAAAAEANKLDPTLIFGGGETGVGAPPPAAAAPPAVAGPPPGPTVAPVSTTPAAPFTPSSFKPGRTGATAPATAAPAVPATYKDAQGVWHVRQ